MVIPEDERGAETNGFVPAAPQHHACKKRQEAGQGRGAGSQAKSVLLSVPPSIRPFTPIRCLSPFPQSYSAFSAPFLLPSLNSCSAAPELGLETEKSRAEVPAFQKLLARWGKERSKQGNHTRRGRAVMKRGTPYFKGRLHH